MISLEDYYDNLYKMFTGWIPWCTPEIAETTTISKLELSLEGVVDKIKKTNPFGGKDVDKEEDAEKALLETPPMPDIAMQQVIDFVKARQAHDARYKSK